MVEDKTGLSTKKIELANLCAREKVTLNTHIFYTPDIQSMWGYIVFAFPFIRSFVRTFVSSFVRLSGTGSKFLC